MTNTLTTITTVEEACDRLIKHIISRSAADKNSDVLTNLEKLALKFYGQEVFSKFEGLSQINIVIQYVDNHLYFCMVFQVKVDH